MKIIILGAGQVGSNLAENLAREANDVTIIDIDNQCLRDLQDRLDIRTVRGMASHPDVLRSAGAEDADMVIAVTNSDEVNMVACQVAYTVFHTPTKIARIRSTGYLKHDVIFRNQAMPVDHIVNPEQIITQDIKQLIDNPGALQVMDFADGLTSEEVEAATAEEQSSPYPAVGWLDAEQLDDAGEFSWSFEE